MTTRTSRHHAVLGDERGQLAPLVVILLPACLLFLALVLDGGQGLAAKTRAIGQAEEAARAGAQEIDLTTYRTTGQLHLDPARAHAAARGYLTALGARGTITVTGTTVHVTVTTTTPTQLLDMVGIPAITVTGRGQARPDDPGGPP